ncbi:phage tail tape measure protein [uncultured Hoeflea sp.]|uniref:phage tail tape measure protein n=1 Tax=uncultured Hoeflea sp. TaxID=538666 RepID=UPI002635C877|nr:phage tail tape measure protein [uncultured Hoeflea sp.]
MADVNRKATAYNRAQTSITRASRLQAAAFTWQDTALASHNARMMAVAAQRQREAATRRAGLMRTASTAALVAGGAGVAGLAVGAGAVRGFATIERRLTRIGINADASATQMETAFQRVRDIADDVGAPVENVVSGLESLIASGKSLDEAMALLPKVAAAAQASDSEFAAMATTADAITGSFGIAADQMGIAFDIIAKAGKAGKFELKDMAAELPSLAPAFAALGYSGEEGLKKLSAALQVVRMETGTSGEAATAFMDVLTKMNSVTVANNFRKQFGVDIRREMEKAKASGEDMLEAFIRLSREAVNGDLSKLPLLFTDKQMQIAMRALINRTDEYRSQLNALGDAAGTVQGDIDRLATNAQKSIDKMSNAWDRLTTSFGSTVAPPATATMDAVSETLDTQTAMDRGFEKKGMGFIESRLWAMWNAGNHDALKSVFWLGGGRTAEDKKRIEAYHAPGADPRVGVDTPERPEGQEYQTRSAPEKGPVIQTRDGTILYSAAPPQAAGAAPLPVAKPSQFEIDLAAQDAARQRAGQDVRTQAFAAAHAPVVIPLDSGGNSSVRTGQGVPELQGLLAKLEAAGAQSGSELARGGDDAARMRARLVDQRSVRDVVGGRDRAIAPVAKAAAVAPDGVSVRPGEGVPELQGLLAKLEAAGEQSGSDLAEGGDDAARAIAQAAPVAGGGFGDAAAAKIRSSAAQAGAEFGDAAAARIRAAAGSIRIGQTRPGNRQQASGNMGKSMPNAGTRPGGT